MSLDEYMPDDGTYIIGPFGHWPFRYRLKIYDHVETDRKDEDWSLNIERRRFGGGSDWTTVHWTHLYNDGEEYINRLKKP